MSSAAPFHLVVVRLIGRGFSRGGPRGAPANVPLLLVPRRRFP